MKCIPKSAWTYYNIRYHQNRQVEAWAYYPKRLDTVNCIIWPQPVCSFSSFTAIPMESNQCQSLQKKKTRVKSQRICWVWGSLIWYKFYPQGKQQYLLVSQLYIHKVDLKCSSKQKTLSFGSNMKLYWFCSWMPLVLCNVSLNHGSVQFVHMAFRGLPAELLGCLLWQAPTNMLPRGRCTWRPERPSLNVQRQNVAAKCPSPYHWARTCAHTQN